jgi:hypothetical protein
MQQLNPTTATYDSLLLAYRFMNERLFKGTLPICLITLQREKKTYGYFSGNRFSNDKDRQQTTDEIALNPQHFRSNGRDDMQVVSTLVHEMAHLWQHHYGKPGRGRYHNGEWASKMQSLGLPASSTGEPGGKSTGDKMSHYIDPLGPFAKSFEKLRSEHEFSLQWIDFSSEEPLKISPLDPGTADPAAGGDPGATSKRTPPPDKSNRAKYSCPDCGLNAWAKPGANLICGDCEKEMAAN